MHTLALVLAIVSTVLNALACGLAGLFNEPKSSGAFAIATLFSALAIFAGYPDASALAIGMLLATIAAATAIGLPLADRLLERRSNAATSGDGPTLSDTTGFAPEKPNDAWFYFGLGVPVIASALASLVAALN
jgi:hypothetical protein